RRLGLLLTVLLSGAWGAAKVPPGLDVSGMDRTVAPGVDFYAYANGGWLSRTSIPPDRASFGTGAIVSELTQKRTVELIQNAAKSSAAAGSVERKIGDYYASFMDED